MTLLIKDGGMTSAALQTQIIGGEHATFHNVLGSVGITNIPAVTIIGPSSVAVTGGTIGLSAGTAILGSVNVGGGVTVLSMPAAQVTPIQFGLSSVVTGQRTMALSIPFTLASDQPAIAVTGAGGEGSVNVLGTVSVLVTGQPIAVSGAAGAGSVNILGGTISLLPPALVTPVQFGLSSVVTGQRTMTLSLSVTLASDQPAIAVTGAAGAGSVNVLGGTVGLLAGTAQVGSVDVRATGLSSVALVAGTNILGSVNVGGSIAVLSLPAVQVTQVQFGLSSVTVGQRTMSLSIPFTLASDQPAIAVTGAAGAGSVNVLGGTISLLPPALVTPVQFGLSSVVTGQRTMAASIPVTLASDQPSINVTAQVSGGGSVVVLGGSISLIPPAIVTPVQFGFSSATVGQKTMSLSIPVTLASDQPSITVTTTGGGSVVVLGGSILLLPPIPITRVQFGLSSAILGQQAMAASVPMVLASSHSPIAIAPGNAETTVGGVSVVNVSIIGLGIGSATMGQRTMAFSMPFTLASDQPAIAVTGAVGSGSVNVLGGSIALIAGTAQVGSVDVRATGLSSVSVTSMPSVQVTLVQFGLSSVVTGQRTMAASIPVTLASDQPSINVTAQLSGGGSVVVLGGSISLIPPALVTPVQFGFSSATVGQKTMAFSIPVTLASDQPAISVSGTFTAADVQRVQFGTSSTIVGQRTMALSIPFTLASDQPAMSVVWGSSSTLGLMGSVNVGGSVAILSLPALAAGTAILGSVNVGGSVTVLSMPAAPVTQVQFGLSSATLGQKTMTLSMPVTLASDQPAIAVTGAVGSGSVNVLGGTVGLIPGDVRRVQFGLSSTVMGQTTPALSVPVVLAANQVLGSVQVSGGTVQLLAGTAILGSVNVGGGVSVLSMPDLVTRVQFGLSSAILGQQARTLSVPVTLSSDQNFVDVKRQAIRTLVPAYQYQDIPRVSVNITLGSTGALGDWLELVLCMVSTAGGARVSVRDGTVGDVINLLPQTPGSGIGPYHIVFGYPSRHGAWQISTDSGVSVRASGIFT